MDHKPGDLSQGYTGTMRQYRKFAAGHQNGLTDIPGVHFSSSSLWTAPQWKRCGKMTDPTHLLFLQRLPIPVSSQVHHHRFFIAYAKECRGRVRTTPMLLVMATFRLLSSWAWSMSSSRSFQPRDRRISSTSDPGRIP